MSWITAEQQLAADLAEVQAERDRLRERVARLERERDAALKMVDLVLIAVNGYVEETRK